MRRGRRSLSLAGRISKLDGDGGHDFLRTFFPITVDTIVTRFARYY